jgi:hypothetical protein
MVVAPVKDLLKRSAIDLRIPKNKEEVQIISG